MKILNLHLMAFGPFTGLDLDFIRDHSGMQIIYGPNEAGKSSALRALTGWLFGIEHNSPDNFIHEYQQLKIGGTLKNSAGRELSFIRRKGRSNTVLTPEGQPLEDDILREYLQGIDRQVFLSMFGIDHQALVKGVKISSKVEVSWVRVCSQQAWALPISGESSKNWKRRRNPCFCPEGRFKSSTRPSPNILFIRRWFQISHCAVGTG